MTVNKTELNSYKDVLSIDTKILKNKRTNEEPSKSADNGLDQGATSDMAFNNGIHPLPETSDIKVGYGVIRNGTQSATETTDNINSHSSIENGMKSAPGTTNNINGHSIIENGMQTAPVTTDIKIIQGVIKNVNHSSPETIYNEVGNDIIENEMHTAPNSNDSQVINGIPKNGIHSVPETTENKVGHDIKNEKFSGPNKNDIEVDHGITNNKIHSSQEITDDNVDDSTIDKISQSAPDFENEKVDQGIIENGKHASSETADNIVGHDIIENEMHLTPDTTYNKDENDITEAPDGGFGWIVAMAVSFPMVFIQMSSNYGILFSPPLLQMGASSSTIAGIYTVYATMWNLSGPFVGPLTQQYGWRTIGVAGYLLISISLISSAFVTKPFYLYFTYSLLTGIGGGLLGNQAFLIISSYFKKNRGLANAIFMGSCSSGHFLGPLFLTYLLETYSFKGAALIHGAIVLNGSALALLYHPVEWHTKTKEIFTVNKSYSLTTNTSNEANKQLNSTFFIVIQKIIKNSKILSSYRAIILVLGSAFVRECYGAFLMLIPFALQSEGHTLETAAWCLSIASIGNIISRITNSVLSDHAWFNMQWVFVTGIFLTALSMLVFSLTTDMVWRNVFMVVFGYGTGIIMTLHNLVMVEVMGLQNLPAMIGVSCLANAGAANVIGPTAGLVRDMSGSYALSMLTLAVFSSMSFLLWELMPLAKRYDLASTMRTQKALTKDVEKSKQNQL